MKAASDRTQMLSVISSRSERTSLVYGESEIAFRQLRHATRNTLQRIVCLIAESPGVRRTPEDIAFSQDLVRRICLSAEIADSLFGFTRPYGNMHQRLHGIGNSLARVFADPRTEIDVHVSVEGNCPEFLIDTILQIAFELVGETIRYVVCNKKPQPISVKLICIHGRSTILEVTTEGSGFNDEFTSTEGFQLAQAIACTQRGKITFIGERVTRTIVEFR